MPTEKADGIAAGAASKTVEHLAVPAYRERRGSFIVEGAQAFESPAAPGLEFHMCANEFHDIARRENL